MKKLSDFKENKVKLKNISGGKTFSYREIYAYPGGDSTPGNYVSVIETDFNGTTHWNEQHKPLNYSINPRFV